MNELSKMQISEEPVFDLVRVSKAKKVVDLCSNTIMAYHSRGLPLYRMGNKTCFFSKAELEGFIRRNARKLKAKKPRLSALARN